MQASNIHNLLHEVFDQTKELFLVIVITTNQNELELLKKALHALNIDDFGGKASKKKMSKIITRYVEENCHCSII